MSTTSKEDAASLAVINAAISMATSGIAWYDRNTRSMVEKSLRSEAKITDDGRIVVNRLPLDQHIVELVRNAPNLLAVGVSGDSTSGTGGGTYTTEELKPGTSKERLQEIAAHVAKLCKQ